jgi:hypothetical protein
MRPDFCFHLGTGRLLEFSNRPDGLWLSIFSCDLYPKTTRVEMNVVNIGTRRMLSIDKCWVAEFCSGLAHSLPSVAAPIQ